MRGLSWRNMKQLQKSVKEIFGHAGINKRSPHCFHSWFMPFLFLWLSSYNHHNDWNHIFFWMLQFIWNFSALLCSCITWFFHYCTIWEYWVVHKSVFRLSASLAHYNDDACVHGVMDSLWILIAVAWLLLSCQPYFESLYTREGKEGEHIKFLQVSSIKHIVHLQG